MANYIGEFVKPGKFRTRFKSSVTGILSKQATSNLSPSNIIGFFDKPDRNLKGKGAPCRLTAFNRDYPELWQNTIPFLKQCDNMFKKLVIPAVMISFTLSSASAETVRWARAAGAANVPRVSRLRATRARRTPSRNSGPW